VFMANCQFGPQSAMDTSQRDVLEFKSSAQIRTLYLLYLIRSNSTRAKSRVTCSFNRGQVVEGQRI
jgi:hypothetical protein